MLMPVLYYFRIQLVALLDEFAFWKGCSVDQDKESFWAEPHNNNPLEKTTLSREGFGKQSKEMKDEEEVR